MAKLRNGRTPSQLGREGVRAGGRISDMAAYDRSSPYAKRSGQDTGSAEPVVGRDGRDYVLSPSGRRFMDARRNDAKACRGADGATRRGILVLTLSVLAAPVWAQSSGMSRATAFAFSFQALDGPPIRLADHAGKPVLIVNTASLCGYTPQYAALQEVWARYRDRGLLVIGVPSNDFGGQEPGEAAEIGHTTHSYGVTFPLAAKANVRGANPHPFYKWAAAERPLDAPRWNFHKYLVGRDGRLAGVFPSAVAPTDPQVIAAIERQLPAP
jgi:glutathione peroxidase